MSRNAFSASAWRKQLPLPARMGYGWLLRKLRPHPILDNEEWQRYYQFLQKTQWWSRRELEEYQSEQLRKLVQHAYENVPYYRRIFDERKLKPADVKTLNDLHKIPILTKEDVRANPEDFIARNVDRSRLRLWTTGGSSGAPLGVYQDATRWPFYGAAFMWRQWQWAGFQFGDRRVRLMRENVDRWTNETQRACWDYNTIENELVLAGRSMNEENLAEFTKKIREFKPKYLEGLASSVEVLARFMSRNGIEDIRVKGIFCEAERVYRWQREFIEPQFHSRVWAGYGMSERCADAVECEQHQGYHVSMEYGILELVDKNDEPITQAGEIGNVVGTGFHTWEMPFIRYRMNDLATYAAHSCPCGRQLTLIRDFMGRMREFLVSKTGTLVPAQLLWTGRHPVWARIREMNILQEREGEFVLRIVKAPQFSSAEIERDVLEESYKVLNHGEFQVRVQFMEELPLTVRGKLGVLEQKLPIEFADLDRLERETIAAD